MAANDYYNSGPSPSIGQRRRSEAPLPPLPIPTSTYTAYRPSGYPPSGYQPSPLSPTADSPNISPSTSHSQHNIGDDSRYYGAGGGGIGGDPAKYSDDIPLRPQPQNYSSEGVGPAKQPFAEETGLPSTSSRPHRSRNQQRRKKAFFSRKTPWVVYTLTLIQVCVFIAELARNGILTKTPIEIHPQVNPMLGPSPYVLINMGARYVPCMKNVNGIQNSAQPLSFPCPNTTSSDVNSPMNQCNLAQLCGFSPVPNPHVNGLLTDKPEPNQWFRFIIPMFLHAGIIHISFNMLLQLTLGREMEEIIGPVRFLIVYLSSGIFGFVMGGNFAPSGIASTGASGSLFGIIALNLLDLLYTWGDRKSPGKELAFIALDIVISFVLGLLPGLDNFSHIGGFLMGLVLGVCILRSPNALRQRVGTNDPPYAPVNNSMKPAIRDNGGFKGFAKQPLKFFEGRKPLWWAWWLIRAAALVGVLVCFILLLNNFYKDHKTCSWCKYLSCLNIKNWCDVGNLQLMNTTTTSNGTTSNKRDLFGVLLSADLQGFF